MSEREQAPDSLTRSVKRGVALSAFTFGVTKGLAAISLLVLTHLLAPSQFGLVAAIALMLSLIELTADLGMVATVIYEQEKGITERVQVAFTVNMLLVTALTAATLLAAPLIAGFFHASREVGLFRLAALDIFLTGLGGIHDGLLLRDLRFRTRITTQVASALVRATVGVLLAVLGYGAASLVWGTLCGTAASTIALWWCTRFWPKLRFDRTIAASMLGYGLGASMLSVLAQATTQIDTTVVGRVLGPRALGLYSVAFRLPSLLLENISNQISLVAFPALARKRITDPAGIGASTGRLVRYQSLYALPLAAGMALLAGPIVEIVFSAKWRDATGVFAAVSVMSGISASGFALGDAFKALGRQRVMVVLNVVQLPLLVVTIILLAPYGITAVAWGRVAGMTLWVAMIIAAAASVLGIPSKLTLRAMWPAVAAAAGVILAVGAVRLWSGLSPLPELLVGGVAGFLGGSAALAVLAPAMFGELRRGANGMRRKRLRAVAKSSVPPR